MAYNPYGGPPYGPPPNSYHPNPNPFPGTPPATPGMGYPPPGMSPAAAAPPGMAPPPGMHHTPPPQANRPPSRPHAYGGRGAHNSGLPPYAGPGFPPPSNLPGSINMSAPVLRLGGAGGPPTMPGASSLPARPNLPTGPGAYGNGIPTGPGGWRGDVDTPLAARSSNGTPLRPDFRADRFGFGGDRDGPRGGERNGMPANASGAGGASVEPVRPSLAGHTQGPPTNDEKLRTIFVHKVPAGVGGEAALQQLLGRAGRLRRWDSGKSQLADHKDTLFGFAQYEDAPALASAIALLRDVQVPVEKQEYKEGKEGKEGSTNKDALGKGDGKSDKKEEADAKDEGKDDEKNDDNDPFPGIPKVAMQVAVDPVSLQYIAAWEERQSDEVRAEATAKREALRPALEAAVRDLFFPPKPDTSAAGRQASNDVLMTDISGVPLLTGTSLDGIDVAGLPLATAAAATSQEDELADVPAEMREMVAAEIASFRDRSTQRDLERLQREQEMEELERRRNGQDAPAARPGRLESPARGRNAVHFVNGDRVERRDRDRDRDERPHARPRDDPDTDASDAELDHREQRKAQADEDRQYAEAERKWTMRERQRAAALDRERDRDHTEAEHAARHRTEALERDATWDDEREAARKSVLYYRDHAAWLRKRAHDKADEEARDAADRRAEQDEARRQATAAEAARSQADSFLDGMATAGDGAAKNAAAQDKETAEKAQAQQQQKVTISFGAAAQRNQAQRGTAARRTVAEVEGLLDDGEHEGATKRQLVPIQFEPMAASARMSDEEINEAVRALVQEIPTTQEGLWAWPVQWAYMDDAVVRDKLRPFVEKKVVEYLGVQEQFLVEVVETHLRSHGTPQALVEELQEALDEAAEDLVKKLWRMVIFFTESEKRGLPA